MMLVTDGYHVLTLPPLRAGDAVHSHPQTPQDTIIIPVLGRGSEGQAATDLSLPG